MKVPDSIIQKIQEQLPGVSIEFDFSDRVVIVGGMRLRAQWDDVLPDDLPASHKGDLEEMLVETIVEAYHQTADLRELMNE